MAKDVSGKSLSSHNSSNSPPSNADQQKVPPLRIVLNSAGNQKSSSTALSLSSDSQPQQQQHDVKRDRQDAKTDNVVTTKPSGKVRIKLTSAKQAIKNQSSNDTSIKNSQPDGQRPKVSSTDKPDHMIKEDSSSHCYSHLRRITRRSHRSVQFISNEDEESISSMTSTDENQTTTTNNNDNDINSSALDAPTQTTNSQTDLASSNSTTTSSSTTTNNSSTTAGPANTDAPRRYKRRKGEATECTLSEIDLTLGYQNYKPPSQNSFELFRNIRKQVDKKLKGLTSVSVRVPYGFRDYMLNRGSYLLDGNRLGNGTSLLVNEDGDLYQPSMARWRAFKLPKVSYSVPTRAKAPPSLLRNSPLYDLFVEQEKDRFRMRMQHVKEREKLTLVAEQEIIRVYNQAAMAAANQEEPFSACTMLKHQEVYNYLDADGVMIQAQEDIQPDPMKQNGVRTRRRQHEHVSPPPTRKVSNADDATQNSKDREVASSEPSAGLEESQKSSDSSRSRPSLKDDTGTGEPDSSPASKRVKFQTKDDEEVSNEDVQTSSGDKSADSSSPPTKETEEPSSIGDVDATSSSDKPKSKNANILQTGGKTSESINSETMKQVASSESAPVSEKSNDGSLSCSHSSSDEQDANQDQTVKEPKKPTKGREEQHKGSPEVTVNQNDAKSASEEQASCYANSQGYTDQEKMRIDSNNLGDEDKPALISDAFLSQLQDIDEKWEKIRLEMLIRHRNEAESLNAVQKLEWEWKAKEIGVCDVRTSLIIDNSFVPKLNIFSQDY